MSLHKNNGFRSEYLECKLIYELRSLGYTYELKSLGHTRAKKTPKR